MARTIEITIPAESDVGRIASIHLAAMDSNPLLHLQFPTPASLERLKGFLEADTISELGDPKTGVLIARDVESKAILGFVKWDYPVSSQEDETKKLETGDVVNLEGCRPEYLEGYAALAEEAKKRAFGDRACYRLTFVCTDPIYQGLGAGSLLTKEVMERARADHMPVYLESTLVAVKMYEKLGFKTVDRFEMRIPQRQGGDGLTEIYEEVCMVWLPDEA